MAASNRTTVPHRASAAGYEDRLTGSQRVNARVGRAAQPLRPTPTPRGPRHERRCQNRRPYTEYDTEPTSCSRSCLTPSNEQHVRVQPPDIHNQFHDGPSLRRRLQDRIKLLIQSQDEMLKVGRLSHPYKGTVDCFARIIKEEGFLALYRGNWMNVIRYFPTQALNFTFNVHFKCMFGFSVKKDGF
ncbi:hypothetical protein BJ742DRAFT_567547 [Cladochytrium replicatum]|nr:hypothetical protein BJ742DRAFT_567547 [Cladochytrium replicatum]